MSLNDALIPFAVAALFAVLNWIAVDRRNKTLEYIAKPAVMVALIVAALMLDPASDARRFAFVVALVFSLLGDVFLMLPNDRFIPGVAAFFIAHVAYIVGLRIGTSSVPTLLLGAAIVAVFAATVGRKILIADQRGRSEARPRRSLRTSR